MDNEERYKVVTPEKQGNTQDGLQSHIISYHQIKKQVGCVQIVN